MSASPPNAKLHTGSRAINRQESSATAIGPHRPSGVLAAIAALIFCGTLSVPARANPVSWRTDVRAGIAEAQKKNLPLFFFVPPSRDVRREAENWEDELEKVLRSPEVSQILGERFVPVRVQRSTVNDALFDALDLKPGKGLKAVAATPQGQELVRFAPVDLMRQKLMLDKLTRSFRRFRSQLYDREIKPILSADTPEQSRLLDALAAIQRYLILKADADVVALLGRQPTAEVRAKANETLAALSTPGSARALLERAGGDQQAAKALRRCTPGVADVIADGLSDRYDAKHIAAYNALADILKLKNRKPPRFWTSKLDREKASEAERVRKLAARTAAEWKKRFDDFR